MFMNYVSTKSDVVSIGEIGLDYSLCPTDDVKAAQVTRKRMGVDGSGWVWVEADGRGRKRMGVGQPYGRGWT